MKPKENNHQWLLPSGQSKADKNNNPAIPKAFSRPKKKKGAASRLKTLWAKRTQAGKVNKRTSATKEPAELNQPSKKATNRGRILGLNPINLEARTLYEGRKRDYLQANSLKDPFNRLFRWDLNIAPRRLESWLQVNAVHTHQRICVYLYFMLPIIFLIKIPMLAKNMQFH